MSCTTRSAASSATASASSAVPTHCRQPRPAAPASRRTMLRPAAAAASGAAPDSGSNGAQGQQQPRRRLSLATQLVHSEGHVQDPFGASMPPIYQTATFQQPDAVEMGEYDYSRSGNPTRTVLEKMLAQMEVRCGGALKMKRWLGW